MASTFILKNKNSRFHSRVVDVPENHLWTIKDLENNEAKNEGDHLNGKIPEYLVSAAQRVKTEPESTTLQKVAKSDFLLNHSVLQEELAATPLEHKIPGTPFQCTIWWCIALGPTNGTFVIGQRIPDKLEAFPKWRTYTAICPPETTN